MSFSTAPISVIMPCFNAEATIGEALGSLFTQTAPPMEVLVIDDGSRDRTVEVARSFDPSVRVLRNPHRGPGAARRLGVTEARGTYIAHVDADDVIEPTKHERQLDVLEHAGPYTLVHTGSSKFGEDDADVGDEIPEGAEATGHCTRTIFERNPVCGASTMLRRSVILELGNYDADLQASEDFCMSLLASTLCRFVYLPEALYRRRRHHRNITNRASRMAYYHWLAQERFRRRCPEAFARLPGESVQQFMVEPVLRAAREAYWRRDPRDYLRLLRLTTSLAPGDPGIRQLWRRRWCPMGMLRLWDRFTADRRPFLPEVS